MPSGTDVIERRKGLDVEHVKNATAALNDDDVAFELGCQS